jgi:hypothetical protein
MLDEKMAARPTGKAVRMWLAAVAAVLLFAGLGARAESRVGSLCGEVPAIAGELTEISGMKLRHPVPCDFITRDKVNEFLRKRVKEVASPEEIRAEELILKKFGLVPQDFDLARSTVDLLTEQAAAFYDYNRKKLFITETTAAESQEPVLAHELAHAIADQNFNLARYIRQGRQSDDGDTARLAVMEGQATWMMSEYLARKSGESLRTSPALVVAMSNLSEAGAGQYPVYDKSPLYLRMTLVFPYTKGMLFQDALVQRDGREGFAEVFRRAPVSTQQILHPEKYFAEIQPAHPTLPDPHLPRGYKSLVGGTMGELDVEILLEQYAGKERAAAIAPHWRGFTFELREKRKAGRAVLLYAAEWDSEDAARQFQAAWRDVLAGKWKSISIAAEGPDSLAGTGDDGRFELRRSGTTVTGMEGLDPALH